MLDYKYESVRLPLGHPAEAHRRSSAELSKPSDRGAPALCVAWECAGVGEGHRTRGDSGSFPLLLPEDLPPSLLGRDDFKPVADHPRRTLVQLERAHILAALSAHRWNQTKVAAELGISRTTLWRKMKRYAIDLPS